MPSQPEVERYLNYVCDRLDLRRDIQFETRVEAADWDAATNTWVLTTTAGEPRKIPTATPWESPAIAMGLRTWR